MQFIVSNYYLFSHCTKYKPLIISVFDYYIKLHKREHIFAHSYLSEWLYVH